MVRTFMLAGGVLLALASGAQHASAQSFTITSSEFKDGGMLQTKNAGNNKQNPNCIGDNVSPPLAWTQRSGGHEELRLDHV